MFRRSGVPAVAVTSLLVVSTLVGCTPGGGQSTLGPTAPPVDPGEALTQLDGASWSSGGMVAFDALVTLLPGVASLRDQFVEQNASGDAAAAVSYGLKPIVADKQTKAALQEVDHRAATSGMGAGLTAGIALAGPIILPAAHLPTLATEGGTQELLAGAWGADAVNAAQDAWRQANENGTADDPRLPGEPDEEHLGGDQQGNGHVQIDQHHESSADGATATTDTTVRYEGKVCPAADGKFDITATLRRNASGTAGGSAAYSQDLKAHLVGTLGDDAMPVDMEMTTTQSTSETGTDGAEKHITTMHQMSWEDYITDKGWDESENPTQDLGHSDGISPEDASRLAQDGQTRADSMLIGLYTSLARQWLEGKCVTIDTDLPTQVGAETVTDFTVKVVSNSFGNEAQGPLHLSLQGRDDLNPLESVSTGGFHYTAGEVGTKATISIKATSKQGGAMLDRLVTVGYEGWEVDGVVEGIHFHSGLCKAAWEQRGSSASDPMIRLGRSENARITINNNYVSGATFDDWIGPASSGDDAVTWQTDANGDPTGLVMTFNMISSMTDGDRSVTASLTITPAQHDLKCDYGNLAANEEIMLP